MRPPLRMELERGESWTSGRALGSYAQSGQPRASVRKTISLLYPMLRLWNAVETSSLLCPSCSLCGFSFASNGFTLGFVRLHEIGRRCSFERQSIADFTHNALLQRLNKVDARVAARNFRRFQVQLGEFAHPAERLTARHNFGNHSPFVSGTRRERLWVQQERLRSSRSSAITPGGKDSVAGRNARGEVGHILEGRTIRRHNYTGK